MSKYHLENYESNNDRQLSQKQPAYSPLESLQELAEARQAHQMSVQTLVAYARKLEAWPDDEIYDACQNLSRRPRKEGETAFPELGAIIAELRQASSSRVGKTAAEKNAAEIEDFFWEHVDYQIELRGCPEQQFLDTVMQPGFVGRKAGTRPVPLKEEFCGRCYEGLVRILIPGSTQVMKKCRCVGGWA